MTKKRKRSPVDSFDIVNRKKTNKQKQNLNNTQLSKPDDFNNSAPWSKSKRKRMRKLLAKQQKEMKGQTSLKTTKSVSKGKITSTNNKLLENNNGRNSKKVVEPVNEETQIEISGMKKGTKKSELQQTFMKRLIGSRFRDLNEKLYTSDSSWAYNEFTKHPELFDQYHEGFRTQVESWPVNPVDVISRWIQNSLLFKQTKNQKLVVADFGCGDAKLAAILTSKAKVSGKQAKIIVHSFDLVANGNKYITPCDIANVPLSNESVDIGVFCLALMGTNLRDFISEAHRVLKVNGILKIAEVTSRFDPNLQQFYEMMHEQYGFVSNKNKPPDTSNKMFVLMEFIKTTNDIKSPSSCDTDNNFKAKPCIYKRR